MSDTITSGFFESLNGDRTYSAEDFGALFDGVVTEGIFTTIYPGRFECTYLGLHPTTGRDRIGVAAGKAWFNHTWITNTEQNNHQMPVRATGYWTKVAMCIVVDKRQQTRANSIAQEELGHAYGSLANAQSDPIPSTFYNPETNLWRYPLAFVYIPPSGNSATPTITDNRGTATCPYSRAGEEVIDVAHGGTGATTPSQALANLGASPVGHNHHDWYYLKADLDTMLAAKANASDVYTKTQVDSALAGKSNTSHTHDDRYFTETEVTTKLAAKANVADVYTKAQVDDLIDDVESGAVDPSKLSGVVPINKGGTGVAAQSKQAVREGLEITPANIGAAAASHEHSASAITSGTLPIARGGTGATSAADARTQLGAAAASHTHGAGDIASGTLGSDRLPTVPVSKGGTGATTAAAALTALGAAAASHNHAAGNITSGTLSIDRLPTITAAKGGTGQTSLQGSLDALIGSGRIKLTSSHYGTSLPSSGNVAGRIFFLKV